MDVTAYMEALRVAVEAELDRRLPAATAPPERLHDAMRYSVFAGGKRVRAALVIMAGETFGGERAALLPAAAAIELIHTYSLVHDDLPALDDDDVRRGRPSLHRQYDEATAILAGDALLTLGLTLLAAAPEGAAPAVRRRAVELTGEAIGTAGMIGGQARDLEAEREWPADPAAMLEWIHRRKTGALIVAALRLGGLHAGAEAADDARLAALGGRLGLMFQIADDILDVEGSAGSLGKAVRKDASARKLTYPALHGLAASKSALHGLREEALELAASLPAGGGPFPSLIDFLATRRS